MKKISKGYIVPSACFSIPKKQFYYEPLNRNPKIGDVVYGKILRIGQHATLENCYGRIHQLHDHTRALFVYGNRYAPDYFEALIPEQFSGKTDLVARSGLISDVKVKNSDMKDPTKLKILGYVLDDNGNVVNTRNYTKIKSVNSKVTKNKLILSIGTAMNSGKTTTATHACWSLNKAGYRVTASKVTGTASLKDILSMQDAGALKISDFTYFGYPSTYMVDEKELMDLFHKFDSVNNEEYWVVEFADGVLQRETKMLLKNDYVKSRIHKLLFSSVDAFSAIGGLRILNEEFGLKADAISGIISGSPLLIQEFRGYSDIPVINNRQPKDFKNFINIIS